ncbi:carbamoyltransferase HypF [Paenibacillus thiaminolyticus]|uniref:Carbamoyltransferase n=1 Tax=Paenibacillus thiaminolyticus TaxID=49283 RepID=A0AAP9DRB0_PANTH|nr:carbamoyltransferase HypF [Paenibacillus thiaminolyticus]SUA98466.1 Carbamoyltransferase hypF [Paenibacillus thiaminolyticus]
MDRLAAAASEGPVSRVRIYVTGIVQGVGFRPYVFRLANRIGLSGHVRNRAGEVILEIEGRPLAIEAFVHQLRFHSATPIRIDALEVEAVPAAGDSRFIILPSEEEGHGGGTFPAFPPDLAVCPDCLRELGQAGSRFYQYPFISCMSCGPRFSAIRSLPYDRCSTSFANFQSCTDCEAEYECPSNRRFHAQTIACPRCGPHLELRDAEAKVISGSPLPACQAALREGAILAIKGIGGFHLVCDAKRKHTVEQLRLRKRRPNKPFALMAKDCSVVGAYFDISDAEMEALTSAAAPIVLVKPKPEAAALLPLEVIAPGLGRIGIMLPYAPLHELLFAEGIDWIVATSGNRSGFPIAYDNEEALLQLQGIADLFVLHNRDIVMWCDDSVGQAIAGEFQIIRRSRGYVPEALPVPLPRMATTEWPTVLGIGSEMKNTFCFLHNGKAFLSQHMGDLHTLECLRSQLAAREHFSQLLQTAPRLIAFDPHPDYLISREVRHSAGTPAIPVYHHHAHMAACMAENGIDAPVIGCILDGTGYGPDGLLWGCEILAGDYIGFERVRHLRPIVLPGGEAAIRHPWMTGFSLLHGAAADRSELEAWAAERFPRYASYFPIVAAQLCGRLPSPSASSAGRLFDGISAILNVCMDSTYEGEAAIRVSELAECSRADGIGIFDAYSYGLAGDQWDVTPMIRGMMHDLRHRLDVSAIARKCHHTVASMILEGVSQARRQFGLSSVVFSGGAWNNRYLQRAATQLLAQEGFSVYTHKKVPSGDGGIALGQAVCGLWRWVSEHVPIGASASAGSISEGLGGQSGLPWREIYGRHPAAGASEPGRICTGSRGRGDSNRG